MNAFDRLHTVELLALLEEASAPLNHDVRNRIASVRNLAFFVRRKLAPEADTDRDPRVLEFLGKIESEVQRTDEAIDAWSTRTQGVRARVVARVSAFECVHLAVAAARLPSATTLELSLPSSLTIELDVDLEVLAFALRCLIENAAEAAPSGKLRVSAAAESGQCRLSVRDQGPGIVDPARCIERFVSSKPGHLGLGLSMARRIAVRFGGDLAIGRPAEGAEVSISLPMSDPANPS